MKLNGSFEKKNSISIFIQTRHYLHIFILIFTNKLIQFPINLADSVAQRVFIAQREKVTVLQFSTVTLIIPN